MLTSLFFLSSGLFLGWSLGANDAANVWGTAVGTRMINFTHTAFVCSIFVILGAVISGSGASHTLGRLGEISTITGAFAVALAAALSVYWMTKAALPVSTSQAIVGAIVGWNLFSGSEVNTKSLVKIFGTWVFSPILSALLALVFYFIVLLFLKRTRLHLFKIDRLTKISLLVVGAFGSYSLGANNIANVMGVFIPTSPFSNLHLANVLTITSAQQLFLLGGIAIAIGVFTYSQKVMLTVGSDIYKLSPITAFIVVLSSSIVLFLFASEGLHNFLVSHSLPPFPLVPLSSLFFYA